jgi:hypothetical protein
MNIYSWAIIAFTAGIIFVFLRRSKRKKTVQNLLQDLANKNYHEFNEVLEKNRNLFPRFNYEYLLMHRNILQRNSAAVATNIQHIESYALNDKQKETAFYDAFNYFMKREDYTHAEQVMKTIGQCKDEELKFIVKSSYDSIALKGHHYQEELLNRITKREYEPQKGYYELILSYIYLNMHDQTNAVKYKECSEQDMKSIQNIMQVSEHK